MRTIRTKVASRADAGRLPQVFRASEQRAAQEEGRAPRTIIEELADLGKIDITITQDLGMFTRDTGYLNRGAP
ncbi:MAG: hypothetical protein LBF93_09690, partial [Zoogloeaceae bacterium]|nr:hypothetical protein [Zoogloeaceae bacterium]